MDCTTGLALDGTHKITGFDVETSQIQIPSLFAYKGEGKMNTKYFCRPYLVGDMKIPENVRPKVLMYLQQAYSNKTGGDLGVKKTGIVVINRHYKNLTKNYHLLQMKKY